MPAGDLFEVKVYIRQNDQVALNVSHWRIMSIAASTPADQAIANGMADHLFSTYKGTISDQATVRGLTVQYLAPGTARLPVADNGDERGPGTNEGDPLPLQVAGLIKLTTGLAGRHFRGRKYIPFMIEDDNDANGRPNATALTQLGALATKYTTDALCGLAPNTALLHCHIFDRVNEIATAVNGAVVRTRWATQRRRSDINRSDPADPF